MKKTRILKSVSSVILVIMLIMMCVISSMAVTTKEADTKSEGDIPAGADKITERLKTAMNKQRISKIPVMVWLEDTDISEASAEALTRIGLSGDNYERLIDNQDITMDEIQLFIETKRAKAAERYKKYNEEKVKKYFEPEDVIYISKYSPVILLNMDSNAITEAAEKKDVVFMDCYLESNEIEVTMANEVTRTANVRNSYGYGGAGVKIGIFEYHITDSSFPGVNIVSQYGNTGSTSSHANSVLQIIASVAPEASYYVAGVSNDANVSNMEAIEWLISQGVNVINASRAIGGDNNNTYGSMSRWLDHIAYNHDIHFVKSSGNSGQGGVTSGGMAYNILTVGNIDDGRTISYSDDVIDEKSSYYAGNVLAYKPDICAPGTGLTTRFKSDFTGTSASAPQVAGAIALLCQGNPTLTVRQDAVKAILTASVNFSSPHAYVPYNTAYIVYGAGLLDTYGAVWVAEKGRYEVSSISSSGQTKTHTFTVTNSHDRIRVSLAYLKNSNMPSSNHIGSSPTLTDTANLDIEVYAPGSSTPIAKSGTSRSNVEIVDFSPTTAGTYRIVVKNLSSSGTTYYGLAWR